MYRTIFRRQEPLYKGKKYLVLLNITCLLIYLFVGKKVLYFIVISNTIIKEKHEIKVSF